MFQSLMPNIPKDLPDRRVDYRQRVQFAIRKAHDRLFSNLNNPSEPSAPSAPKPPQQRPEQQ